MSRRAPKPGKILREFMSSLDGPLRRPTLLRRLINMDVLQSMVDQGASAKLILIVIKGMPDVEKPTKKGARR